MPATKSQSLLADSFRLSAGQFPRLIPPAEVLGLFHRRRIDYVLIGQFGLVEWLGTAQPSAELDLVIPPRQRKRAVKLLHATYPHLRVADQEWGTLFQDLTNQRVKIKLLLPTSFLSTIFSQTRRRTVEGVPCLIPNLEMAILLAFAALLNPQKPAHEKDAEKAAFITIVKANKKVAEPKLKKLCDALSPGLGDPLLKLVRSTRRTGQVTM